MPNRHPLGASYWKLWTSSGMSNLADGLFSVALPLVAIAYTQEPILIAGVALALRLPWLLFALQAGALADRLDRRWLMVTANSIRAAALVVLAIAMFLDLGSIWLIYVVALGIGFAETIYDTSAQSIMPQIVPKDQLSRANGRLYAVELTANAFIGPPLGGFLVAVGAALAFANAAGLWILAVGVLLLIRGNFKVERTTRTSIRADIAEGLRYLLGHRILRTLAIMTGIFNLASNAAFAVFVLYAVGPTSAMNLTEAGYGLLLTATAVGSLLGSLVAERVERRLGRARTLGIVVMTGGLVLAVPAFTDNPFIIAAGFFIDGIAIVLWNVVAVSLRQRIAPAYMLGRVNSSYRLLAWGTIPLGALLGGLFGQWLGLPFVFLAAGLLTVGLVGLLWILTDEAMDAAEAETAE
ncbi:MFS transporter [Diaminobutyricimonas sp. LJ205]|uniref:MFS transporter n=1 Tax=Diaminobutyricimonas sp. LJ205 TaxID=2683590 RepID=UPI0012F4ED8D|nr:MFS transporter [Diaminobutyricimonas sp. LJ205]